MTPSEFQSFSAHQLAEEINAGQCTPTACYDFFRTKISDKRSLNALLWSDDKVIGSEVKKLQAWLNDRSGPLPLAGVPIIVKDNISTKGIPTTCASKMLEGYTPVFDATVVEKLRKAGAFVIGKANCDEFAMGSTNENSAFGPVKNPWNHTHVPGGSSGGSAASVAADFAPIALGTDTGGSIRLPASHCNLVGVKPTYGRVSRYGVVAYGSSLDQVGPLAKNCLDAALTLDVISGHDPRDSTSAELAPTECFKFLKSLDITSKQPLTGYRVGIIKELFQDGLSEEVRRLVEDAAEVLRSKGASVIEVSLPSLKYSIAVYYMIAPAEASANLARYDGIRFGLRSNEAVSLKDLYMQSRSRGFGREVKQRIMLGTFALSSGYYDAYYGKAVKIRQVISKDFAKAFQNVDVLLAPTSPKPAPKLGEKPSDPLSVYLSDVCTISANLSQVPAISLPCGFSSEGLPVGFQLMANKFSEETMFKGAYVYEQATHWGSKRATYGG